MEGVKMRQFIEITHFYQNEITWALILLAIAIF